MRPLVPKIVGITSPRVSAIITATAIEKSDFASALCAKRVSYFKLVSATIKLGKPRERFTQPRGTIMPVEPSFHCSPTPTCFGTFKETRGFGKTLQRALSQPRGRDTIDGEAATGNVASLREFGRNDQQAARGSRPFR